MRFAIDIRKSTLPRRYGRRVASRNGGIRLEAGGYANYGRWWLLGLDAVVEWGGALDPAEPDWSYRAAAEAKGSTARRKA